MQVYNIVGYAEHTANLKVLLGVCRSLYKRRDSSDGGDEKKRKEKKKETNLLVILFLGLKQNLPINVVFKIPFFEKKCFKKLQQFFKAKSVLSTIS